MKHLAVLGSTGSIGQSTLEIAARYPDRFKVRALAAKTSVDALARQIRRFSPDVAVVYDEQTAVRLKEVLGNPSGVEVLFGQSGYIRAATMEDVDTVVAAVMGAAGLIPVMEAVKTGKTVALANKETLVVAGELVMAEAKARDVAILPVDSEHSAIFQCLSGQRRQDLARILLTASGGPFRTRPASEFSAITVKQALNHPNWSMGQKITIDSATLMNKGLEVIEAKWLFNVEPEQIQVVVHPQSIIHSMVAYKDGGVIAQMGLPDMKGAIAYALSYPERLDVGLDVPDFFALKALTFEPPDMDKFPCLSLAFAAIRQGGSLPAIMNAANERAVAAFLSGKILFDQIPVVIEKTMNQCSPGPAQSLEDLLDADRRARKTADKIVSDASAR